MLFRALDFDTKSYYNTRRIVRFRIERMMCMDDNYEIVSRMMFAINKIDGVYYLLARHYGINENALSFLYALVDGKPHSQKEISDEWKIPRTTINSIVKNMLSDGYIVFTGDQNAKEKTLILTEKGQGYADGLLHGMYLAEKQAITDTLKTFSPEFVTALEYFSDRLSEGFEKIVRKARDEQ